LLLAHVGHHLHGADEPAGEPGAGGGGLGTQGRGRGGGIGSGSNRGRREEGERGGELGHSKGFRQV
jgi:hypothetical protein